MSKPEPVGGPKSKAYETRKDTRQRWPSHKKRLSKKRHIELKKIVTTYGYIEDTGVVW